jgi:hypothetical protein
MVLVWPEAVLDISMVVLSLSPGIVHVRYSLETVARLAVIVIWCQRPSNWLSSGGQRLAV